MPEVNRDLLHRRVEDALRTDPRRSNQSIADELSTDAPVVARLRHELEQRGTIKVFRASPGRPPSAKKPEVRLDDVDRSKLTDMLVAKALDGDSALAWRLLEADARARGADLVPPVLAEDVSDQPRASVFDLLAAKRSQEAG